MASPLQKLIDRIQRQGAEKLQQVKDLFVTQPVPTGKVSMTQLKSALRNNACEIRFTRRHPKNGRPMTRYMIATNSWSILGSRSGRISLNYRAPRSGRKINHDKYNLVLVWDIIMQDYRCVSMDNCEILNSIPANKFWIFYNNILYPMSRQDKSNYMDR